MSQSPSVLEARDVQMYFPINTGLIKRLSGSPREVLKAVDGVNLELRRGETLGLVGESGCGKSTLGRIIVGLYSPTAGEVVFDGREMDSHRSTAERQEIQMVFQDPYSSLNPRMTVYQTLAELLKVHKIVPQSKIKSRCQELLDLVGLPPNSLDAFPHQFSGGQRQRLSIARALALEPKVLIADEPVSALDVSVQTGVLNLLAELQEELGLTMLFIAHNMAVVRRVCDRVAVMYLGKIVEIGETEDVFENPRHPYTQALLQAIPRLIPGRKSNAPSLPGDLPSPIHLPSGCRFHPRCSQVQETCLGVEPSLIPLQKNISHSVSCHFA